MIEGFEHIIPKCENHPKDRHVLAAAIHSKTETIVTFNVKDFKSEALAPWGITASHPADYLKVLFEHDKAAVFKQNLHSMASKAQSTVPEILGRLAWYVAGASCFAQLQYFWEPHQVGQPLSVTAVPAQITTQPGQTFFASSKIEDFDWMKRYLGNGFWELSLRDNLIYSRSVSFNPAHFSFGNPAEQVNYGTGVRTLTYWVGAKPSLGPSTYNFTFTAFDDTDDLVVDDPDKSVMLSVIIP
jgi:hypothetical protein